MTNPDTGEHALSALLGNALKIRLIYNLNWLIEDDKVSSAVLLLAT